MAKYMSRCLALATVYRHLQPQSQKLYFPRWQPVRLEHGKQDPRLARPNLKKPLLSKWSKVSIISWRAVGVFGGAAAVLLGALAYIKDTKDKGIV